MPRTARSTPAGFCYHLLNRGNRRAEVFHAERDYQAFLALLATATQRFPIRLLAFCLMPNHFHLAAWPQTDDAVSDLMHWLLTTHASRYHKAHRTTGHVWQGRFKAFPIREDDHLLAVLRYIERNPLRAGLAARAEDWPWSSLHARPIPTLFPLLDPGPVPRSADWATHVNTPQTERELAALRRCVVRGMPYGTEAWTQGTAAQLGLTFTLRPRGRPRKSAPQDEPSQLFE